MGELVKIEIWDMIVCVPRNGREMFVMKVCSFENIKNILQKTYIIEQKQLVSFS